MPHANDEGRKIAQCMDIVERLIDSINPADQGCMLEAMSRTLALIAVEGGGCRREYMAVHGRAFDLMRKVWMQGMTTVGPLQ